MTANDFKLKSFFPEHLEDQMLESATVKHGSKKIKNKWEEI